VITVKDNLAGATVKCPKCHGDISVPQTLSTRRKRAKEEAQAEKTQAKPRRPAISFAAHLNRLVDDARAKRFLWMGLGCLGALAALTLLPWINEMRYPGDVGAIAPTEIGLRRVAGLAQLGLSLGAVGFVISAILSNRRPIFISSLVFASGWAVLAVFWRLVDFANWGVITGIGVYLSLLPAFGAAVTLGGLARDQLTKVGDDGGI
jgi:hypothetical protein